MRRVIWDALIPTPTIGHGEYHMRAYTTLITNHAHHPSSLTVNVNSPIEEKEYSLRFNE
jgi:hypothetical protein